MPKKRSKVISFTRVIIPDSHGAHIDKNVAKVFLQDLAKIDPLEVVLLGDHLDAGGTFNSHQRNFTNEMTESYVDDIDATNYFLDAVQKQAPRARYHYLEGNHEGHIERWAARNFESAKDADLFLEHLGPESVLRLKSRGIQYYKRSEQYMGLSIPGAIKLGKCYFVHGISHSKHATATHLARFGANVVHGHTHRAQSNVERTVTSDGHGAWCPGTLARLQPLYKHTNPTNWSHGYGLQFVSRTGDFMHLNVPIIKGKSLFLSMIEALRP